MILVIILNFEPAEIKGTSGSLAEGLESESSYPGGVGCPLAAGRAGFRRGLRSVRPPGQASGACRAGSHRGVVPSGDVAALIKGSEVCRGDFKRADGCQDATRGRWHGRVVYRIAAVASVGAALATGKTIRVAT